MQTMITSPVYRNRQVSGIIGNRPYTAHVKQPIGILVAQLHGDEVVIGGSQVNEKAGDIFDKEFGRDLATQNIKARLATIGNSASDPRAFTPIGLRNDVKRFVKRCERYFKGRSIKPVLFT